MSIVEEKRMNFASVLKKACNDARNGTVMVVPTFNNLTESVGLLREFNVDDNQDNTFPYIESNSPSKFLSPSSQMSTVGIVSNSADLNRMDLFYGIECQELCNNKLLNSVGREILYKQDITLTEEDQDFLGLIGELNVFETQKHTGDVSLFVANEEKQNMIHCYPENFSDQDFQDLSVYLGKHTERINIQKELPMDVRYQPYARCKEQSPEEILQRKERNRLRSKAYRLRKKLQFEALRQEVEDAKIAAEIARKEKEVAVEKLEISGNQLEVNQYT